MLGVSEARSCVRVRVRVVYVCGAMNCVSSVGCRRRTNGDGDGLHYRLGVGLAALLPLALHLLHLGYDGFVVHHEGDVASVAGDKNGSLPPLHLYVCVCVQYKLQQQNRSE